MEHKNLRYSYDTLCEAVKDLQARGYTHDFFCRDDSDVPYGRQHCPVLSPSEFVVDELYRFEGMSDPADESIVFAVSSKLNGIRGLVVNGFGAAFASHSFELVKRL